jgi:hypothetical protein
MLKIQAQQMETQRKAQADQLNYKLGLTRAGIDQEKADNERMMDLIAAHQNMKQGELEEMKTNAEVVRADTDLAIKAMDVKQKHAMDGVNFLHKREIDHGELSRKTHETLLKHKMHEDNESNSQEAEENS